MVSKDEIKIWIERWSKLKPSPQNFKPLNKMSQTETHFGKLRKVELNTSIEEWCKQKCNERGITELPSYMSSWEEEFKDTFYEKFFITEDEIWEAIEHIEESDGDIDVMIPNEDGTITFVMQFYNGGTCLSEMVEDGLTRLKNK